MVATGEIGTWDGDWKCPNCDTPKSLKVGDRVVFEDAVYAPPFSPYYDEYKGHVFEVVSFHYGNTHVNLRCLDADVKVRGYAHPDELRLADDCGMCLGRRGGVKGNENRMGEFILCDYCSAELGIK